jgi:hypothetical protein
VRPGRTPNIKATPTHNRFRDATSPSRVPQLRFPNTLSYPEDASWSADVVASSGTAKQFADINIASTPAKGAPADLFALPSSPLMARKATSQVSHSRHYQQQQLSVVPSSIVREKKTRDFEFTFTLSSPARGAVVLQETPSKTKPKPNVGRPAGGIVHATPLRSKMPPPPPPTHGNDFSSPGPGIGDVPSSPPLGLASPLRTIYQNLGWDD